MDSTHKTNKWDWRLFTLGVFKVEECCGTLEIWKGSKRSTTLNTPASLAKFHTAYFSLPSFSFPVSSLYFFDSRKKVVTTDIWHLE
jgi:hypothetical protein